MDTGAVLTQTPNAEADANATPELDTSDAGPCVFDVDFELSPVIATVGIVQWTLIGALGSERPDEATIEFGRERQFNRVAPVDLDAPRFRTLVLGMQPDSSYEFRISARYGDTHCRSLNFTMATGPAPNALTLPEVTAPDQERTAPGFLVTSTVSRDEEGRGLVFILDEVGTPVWWFSTSVGQITRARMSYDGKHLYARNLNVTRDAGQVVRISLDGLSEEVFDVPGSHHDLAVTPDNGVALLQKSENSTCDDIVKLSEDGSTQVIGQLLDAFDPDEPLTNPPGSGALCHANSILHHAEDDSYTVSELAHNAFVKVSSVGEILWVLGGSQSTFAGEGAVWERQHGHQMLGPNRLLFFHNGSLTSDGGSSVVEVELDFDSRVATPVWSHLGEYNCSTLGDVQRLKNGNTLITYSSSGVIEEVDPSGDLVRELVWPLGAAVGYVEHRPTLYGPPER